MFAKQLQEQGLLSEEQQSALKKEIDEEIEKAVQFSLESPYPEAEVALKDVISSE